ncbi:hypothetical protein SAMN06265222_1263 [Neorhodopirellula lusitana]|uniref:Uncharacterized protein n=1 Tax=Neorhodopirellula lusitana TaxID=445327 RepID=A0ABY1QQX5_9BACT|nr:hypothetical protein SAMN06265222_1263 [Neorhodopirellula lusitana]
MGIVTDPMAGCNYFRRGGEARGDEPGFRGPVFINHLIGSTFAMLRRKNPLRLAK